MTHFTHATSNFSSRLVCFEGGWVHWVAPIKSILLVASSSAPPPLPPLLPLLPNNPDPPCWHLHSLILSKPNQLVIAATRSNLCIFSDIPKTMGRKIVCTFWERKTLQNINLSIEGSLESKIPEAEQKYGRMWMEFWADFGFWCRSIDTFLAWLIWLVKTAITLIGWLDPHTFQLMATNPDAGMPVFFPTGLLFRQKVAFVFPTGFFHQGKLHFLLSSVSPVSGGSLLRCRDRILQQIFTRKLSTLVLKYDFCYPQALRQLSKIHFNFGIQWVQQFKYQFHANMFAF